MIKNSANGTDSGDYAGELLGTFPWIKVVR